MPRRKAPLSPKLAREKARKQVQTVFDKFKYPVRGGYMLQLEGLSFFNDDDLACLQVKLLPFDVSGTAIPNSAPSFFKPWSSSELAKHLVDVTAIGEDGLEMLEIGEMLEIDDPIHGPSYSRQSALQILRFTVAQFAQVPRANLGPGSYETLGDHSKWDSLL
jgi:hypothetical protein